MRPHYADAWRAIAIVARSELRTRRRTFRLHKAKGEQEAALAAADGAAWSALAADWTYYTRHTRTPVPDVSVEDKLAAIDCALERLDPQAMMGGLTASEKRRRALLEAMRWHAEPRAFGIAFCVAITIEARRRWHASNDNSTTSERNAA